VLSSQTRKEGRGVFCGKGEQEAAKWPEAKGGPKETNEAGVKLRAWVSVKFLVP